MTASLTVTSWNLNGSGGVDVDGVAEHVRSTGTDVLVLQEVQQRQARALARALDARSLAWSFKHWPLILWPEGLALLGVTRPVQGVRTEAITARWHFVDSRRRIVQYAEVAAGETMSAPVQLVNLHLSPGGDRAADRERELAHVLGRVDGASTRATVVAGDFNAEPDKPLFEQLRSAGFTTAEKGPTKWRRPPSDRKAEREIDYVWASEDLTIQAMAVPRHGDDGFAWLPSISDHLPVTATLTREAPDG